MNMKNIIKNIKRINPLVRIELHDAEDSFKSYEQRLKWAYEAYIEAERRLLKARKKAKKYGIEVGKALAGSEEKG